MTPITSKTDRLPLPDSKLTIPRIGFGVYLSSHDQCVKSCLTALQLGYRHIDTALLYSNEAEVGQAVRESGLPREDVFVTTKLVKPAESAEKTLEALRDSVDRIGLGYVDLFLIHAPTSGTEGRRMLWQALEKLKDEGRAKSIGVSNFGVKHLQQLKEFSQTIPAVNQIELHPWCQQPEVVEYCKNAGIVIEAYAPLVRAQKNNDPTLVEVAKAHGVSTTQVLIRWSVQHGFVPLPKSDNPVRIKNNADVFGFELTDKEMREIDAKALPGGEGAICPYLAECE